LINHNLSKNFTDVIFAYFQTISSQSIKPEFKSDVFLQLEPLFLMKESYHLFCCFVDEEIEIPNSNTSPTCKMLNSIAQQNPTFQEKTGILVVKLFPNLSFEDEKWRLKVIISIYQQIFHFGKVFVILNIHLIPKKYQNKYSFCLYLIFFLIISPNTDRADILKLSQFLTKAQSDLTDTLVPEGKVHLLYLIRKLSDLLKESSDSFVSIFINLIKSISPSTPDQ
jgi:hypothetical protein